MKYGTPVFVTPSVSIPSTMSFLATKTETTPNSKLNKVTSAISIPSPTPSASSASGKTDLKRKRADTNNGVVFSQPQQTGTGHQIMTQIHYAIEYLKEKDRPIAFKDIVSYLSLQNLSQRERGTLQHILRTHNSVDFDKEGFGGQGSYRFRPKHNVRSAEELKGYLQQRSTAQGIAVRELKEGWPGAIAAIEALERAGELLVTRNKKDNTPKMVWQNDATLNQQVDPEFKSFWHSVQLPANPDDLRSKLEEAGLKPTSAPKETTKVAYKEKKRKGARRGGRLTNTHMAGILKDYSDKRKGK